MNSEQEQVVREVLMDMALSIPRPSRTVSQSLVEGWHERLARALEQPASAAGVEGFVMVPAELTADALYELARRTLWIAFCWNDHNFAESPVFYARQTATKVGIEDFDKANVWLSQPPPTPAAAPKPEDAS